ncbi:MAG: tyrosine-type recombinase/integrase [candidate division WOR-3 bacterium]
MRVYQRKGVWYIDYSFNGRRVRRAVGTSKKMAELALKEIELKIVKGKFLGIAETKEVLFDNLCAEYLNFSKANKAAQSYRRDQVNVKNLLKSFSGKLVSEISAYELERYKSLRVKEVTPASVNRELSCIKHMFNKAVQWGYLKENPLRLVMKFKEPPGRVRYLTEEEIDKLLDCCANHLRPIVVTALNTGMRKGEILNLRWSDVDLKNRVITLKRTKNNEIRMVPINQVLYNELLKIEKRYGSQYVFADKNGKPYGDIKNGFNHALKRAGISDFRFHDLRHTFASRLVMVGVDIRTVQELMGHKDIKMTMRYSHLSNLHLREAVKKLEYGTNLAQGIQDKKEEA